MSSEVTHTAMRDDIIRMAIKCQLVTTANRDGIYMDALERFYNLAVQHERKSMMQLFTDPENQPTQHGTVTVEYMQREIAAEREECAKLCEKDDSMRWSGAADAIRNRGEKQ